MHTGFEQFNRRAWGNNKLRTSGNRKIKEAELRLR